MQMIIDGKIKEGTVINRIGNDGVFKYEYRNGNLIYIEEENIINIFSLKEILDLDFEILEDKKEEIEEIDVKDNRIQATSTGNYAYSISQPMKIMINKINELVRAVNSLGGKI